MPGWTFAQIWEAAADALPDAPFSRQGDRTVLWRDADRRADGLAGLLLARLPPRPRPLTESRSRTPL